MRENEAGLNVPLILVPLTSVLSGLIIGLLCGFIATLRSGAYFLMITLVHTRPHALLVAHMPFLSFYVSPQETVRNSGSFLQRVPTL